MEVDDTLLNRVMVIAKEAGQEILTMYNQQTFLEIKTKQDNSPVTLADLAAHDLIIRGLSSTTPSIPILSEEDPDIDYQERRQWQLYWLVDPLDGTQEFIHRSGQFTVNISLIENGKPILGVIYIPLKEELYFAGRELGAYKQVKDERPFAIKARRWQNQEDITLVATRKELHEDLQARLSVFGKVKITYRSSSLKFCLLAEGNADIYLRKKPIHEWDTGAGQCILEQSGGVVLDSNWQPLRYNTKSHLLNPPFIALGDSKQLLPILKTMPMF